MRSAGAEALAVCAVALQAGALEVALRTVPLSRIVAALRITVSAAADRPACDGRVALSPVERRRLRAIRRLVRGGSRERGLCLRRALLNAYALRSRAPLVRVGIRRTSQGVEAHAWVEVDGVALGFRPGYLPLESSARVAE